MRFEKMVIEKELNDYKRNAKEIAEDLGHCGMELVRIIEAINEATTCDKVADVMMNARRGYYKY